VQRRAKTAALSFPSKYGAAHPEPMPGESGS
jgi:hypothetical protein